MLARFSTPLHGGAGVNAVVDYDAVVNLPQACVQRRLNFYHLHNVITIIIVHYVVGVVLSVVVIPKKIQNEYHITMKIQDWPGLGL